MKRELRKPDTIQRIDPAQWTKGEFFVEGELKEPGPLLDASDALDHSLLQKSGVKSYELIRPLLQKPGRQENRSE